MKANIEELITLNYELEGLLYMALHRGSDTPDKVWELISDKIDSLKEGVTMNIGTPEPEEQPVCESAPAVTPLVSVSVAETEIEPVPEEEETEEPEIPAEPTPEADIEVTVEEENVEEPDSTDTDEIISEEDEVLEDDDDMEEDDATSSAQKDSAAIRLDEKLARESSRNLRKAFSLNDRFRFRRELFGNNESEFTDTLVLVEAMTSLSEAFDYFYNDLQWDKRNPEVHDFMEIIENHFATR